jgi:secreted Zn-dependent insulinase-like peptidase
MALIHEVNKPDNNLGSESWHNWGHIVNEEYSFDSREKEIGAIKNTKTSDVMNLFKKLVFEEPRRLNVRIHSQAKWDDLKIREESIQRNASFYGDKTNFKKSNKLQ